MAILAMPNLPLAVPVESMVTAMAAAMATVTACTPQTRHLCDLKLSSWSSCLLSCIVESTARLAACSSLMQVRPQEPICTCAPLAVQCDRVVPLQETDTDRLSRPPQAPHAQVQLGAGPASRAVSVPPQSPQASPSAICCCA